MNFSEFLDKTWDAVDYCRTLALDAKSKARHIMVEMSMAGGEAPKMPVLFDSDDYKYLQQFPPEIWRDAITWRYNEGLRMLMRHQSHEKDIPEGWDWTDQVVFDDPARKHKKWKFKSPEGKKTIYIGLSKLAHKLTDPPKEHKNQTGAGKAYWAGEGPAIGEIDPNQQDPNHAEHPKQYKHGLYNMDLSGAAEIDPEHIDSMSDWEIQALLPYPYTEMDINHPEVKKRIAIKRKRMKGVLKHTFAGYDVLQKDVAAKAITNWLRGNAGPHSLFGEHEPTVHDQQTGTQQVQYLNPTQVKKEMNGHWNLGLGHENKVPVNIPAYKKKFNFEVLDDTKNTVTSQSIERFVPVLNPAKALPQITLSPEQKKIKEERGSKVVKSAEDLQGLFGIWDILTDEQKQYIKDNSRSLFQVAQAYHNKDEELAHKYDPKADVANIYSPGFRPNYKTPERVSFSLPEDKIDEFIKEYYPRIFAEVLGSETKGAIGETSKGKIDRILESFKKSGKHPPQVIEALEDKAPDLAKFATYQLLTWLDDPRFGIKDDQLGLLKDVPPGAVDEEGNKERRERLVYNFLSSVAQIGFNDVLSRRRRERYGVATKSSLDKPMGDTGETGAGEVAEGQKGKVQHIDTSAKRAWLHSDPSSIVRAAQKPHKMFSNMTNFMATKRNFILDKLKGSPLASKDLKSAQDNISVALKLSQQLYEKYDQELAKKYPDPAQREEEVMKLVHQHLPEAIKQQVGDITSVEQENLLAQLKNVSHVGVSKVMSAKLDAEAKAKIEEFLDNLIAGKESHQYIFNAQTNQFEESSNVYHLTDFPPNKPDMVIKVIHSVIPDPFANLRLPMIKAKGPKLYDSIELEHDEDKDEAEIQQEFAQALAKYEGSQGGAAAPQQQPQQPAPVKMPQAPAAPAAAAAAKSIHELLDSAGNFNTPEEMMQIGNALMAKKNELAADPTAAAKLKTAVANMRKRRHLLTQFPMKPDQHIMLKNLEALHGDIHAV